MELTNEDISAFVKANIDNPKAIWTAIFQNNVGFDRVAEASGYSTDQMKQYFVDAGLIPASTTNPSPTASQEPGTNTAPTATEDQSVYPTTNTAPSTPAASPATPTALQPLYAGLSNNSNAADIAAAYREWAGASGGDTTENQRTAESYLSNLGIGSGAIRDAYNAYTAPTAAAVTPVGSNLGLGGNYETAQTYTPTVAGPAVQAASTGYTASILAPAVIATATPFTAAQSGPAAQATGARYVPTTLGNATQATATGYNATRANLGLGLQSLGASDPTQANAKLLSGQVNNPYLDAQADNITRRLNRNLQENILPGIGQGATMAGQYGGSRQGIAQGKAIGDTNDNLANALTNMYSGANEAAQSRMAGAAGSLTGIGASLEGQNANAANQAAQFGAASTNAASLYNAGAQNNFGLANQAALNQAGQFNAGLAAQNSQFNAGQYNQNQQFNTSAQNAVNAQNTAAANNMSQFNAGAQNNFGLANQNALNQAGQFGAASTNAASLYNAGAQNSLNQYNAGMQNQAGQFNAGATNNYNLGLRSSDLGFANLDANIAQNNFGNQLGMANFGLGLYNTLNNQTLAGINAGTNIQNTPLDYQKYFTNSANGVGSGYSTGTTSQTNQGNPLLGALGGAQIGNAWQYPNGRNDIGIYGPGRVSGVNYG